MLLVCGGVDELGVGAGSSVTEQVLWTFSNTRLREC